MLMYNPSFKNLVEIRYKIIQKSHGVRRNNIDKY